MVRIDFIYRLIMNGSIYRVEFGEAIQDFGRDRVEGIKLVRYL